MLNEVEKSFVSRFVDEDEMVDAVRKAVKEKLNELLPVVQPTDTDEVLGQRTRAFSTACGLLDKAFIELREYKGRKNIKSQTNLER